jgi:hypothetical protein
LITSLLKRAYALDIELWTENGKLKYMAPEDAVTEIKQELATNKDALINRLEQNEAAKLEQWAIFEFGEMYSKQLNQASMMCIYRNDDDTFTLWRGGWKTGESKPMWEKTIISDTSFRTVLDRAKQATYKPTKGGSKQWSR